MASDGFHKYNAQYVLRDYFKDRDTYNFKYGLEFGLAANTGPSSTENTLMNLDEDPTILGFDVVILDRSPLFNQIDNFIQFGESNTINEVSNRQQTYNDFISQFAKFFNVDDRNRGDFKVDSRFNSFKTHYLYGVQGLDKLIHYTGIGNEKGRQMTDHGVDKLTFSLTEDVGLNAGYLSGLYRTLIYSKRSGRQVIPENLLRFDMAIIISEVRKFNRVSNAMVKFNSFNGEAVDVFNDNINRYVFTLYDCQFDFNRYSFEDSLDQGGFGGSMDIQKGLSFDVYYKYVGFEMEKFNFHPGSDFREEQFLDDPKFISDQKKVPTTYQVNPDSDSETNQQTQASQEDKHPNRSFDRKYQMNTTTNSGDVKQYEFEFPMINSKYAKSVIDLRNKNAQTAADQGRFRQGLNSIIDRTNGELQSRFIAARSQLVSGLAEKIREATGLRNITSPTNVYEGSTLGQFVLGRVTDFANLAVGTALSSGVGYLNKLSQGVENSVFDAANRGANKLKGFDNLSGSQSPLSQSGSDSIPNVYRK